MPHARLRLVRLEDRRVLNAAPLALLAGSELTVQSGDADGQSDLFHLFATHDDGAARLHVELNGAEIFSGDASQISKISVHGSADDDALLVDFANGSPLPHDGLWFDAGGQLATDSLHIVGGSAAMVNHSLAADASGNVHISSLDGFSTVTFAHVENLHDALQADAREITIAVEADLATLSNADSDGASRLTTDLGTQDTFTAPFDSLTIQLGSTGAATASDGTLSVDGDISIPGGTVHLDAGPHGTLLVTGRIDASDHESNGIGGTVHLLGERVGVFDDAVVDVSGGSGGGTILLGGDQQGDNPEIHNAEFSYVAPEARLLADATSLGDGGRIIVWADDSTRVFGNLSAHGGAAGGSGGFVETSGQLFLDVRSTPLLTSVDGEGGTWLLDPNNASVGIGGTINFTVVNPFTTTDDNAFLDLGLLRNAMTGGANVIVQTAAAGANTQAGDLTLVSAFDFAGTGTNTLAFIAHNNVIINGQIFSSSVDSLNLILRANSDGVGGGDVIINQGIDLGNGSFNSTGVNFQAVAGVQSQGGMIAIDHTGNVEIRALLTTNGDVRIATTGGAITMPPAAGRVVSNDLLLSAANGIGTPTDRILVQVANNLAAQVTSANAAGGIFISEAVAGGNLHIGEVNNAAGVPVVGITTTNNQPIDVRTENGSLFIDRVVKAGGTGSVMLRANDTLGGGVSDVEISADIAGDEVIIFADDEINQLSASSVTTGRNVLLDGFNGVGDDPEEVEVQVSVNLAARLRNPAATGGVFVRESAAGGDLPIGTVQGIVGLSTTSSRPITVTTENGGIVIGADVTANGAGLVTLTANSTGAANDILAGAGRISTATGTISLSGRGIGTGAAGPVLTSVNTGQLMLTSSGVSVDGDIAISNDSPGGLNTNQVTGITTATDVQRATIGQTVGNLTLGNPIGNAVDDLVLRAAAGTINGAGVVTAHDLLLDSGQGIGDVVVPVTTQVNGQLAAQVTSVAGGGGITILEAAAGTDLTIGTFAGVTGVSTMNGQNVDLKADGGRLTINSAVAVTGNATVALKSGGTGAAVDINAAVSSATGLVQIQSEIDITFGGGGTITSTSGDVQLSADFNNDGSGAVTMGDLNLVDAGSGHITVQAAGDVTLGGLRTTNADATLVSSAVRIVTTSGGVVDGGETLIDVEAPNGQLQILAQTGIGSAGPFGVLETRVGRLDVETQTSGNVGVIESDGVLLFRANNRGTGFVSIRANGTMTVDNSAGGVGAAVSSTSGSVSLTASGGASDLVVHSGVMSSSGPISLTAANDVQFGAAGDVNSISGNVVVTADTDVGAGISGSVVMNADTRIDTGTGSITISSDGDVLLTGLRSLNALGGAVSITSRDRGIVDGGDTAFDIDVPQGGLVLTAAMGIGSGNPLEITAGRLSAFNTTSGNVELAPITPVGIDRLQQAGPGNVTVVSGGTLTVNFFATTLPTIDATTGNILLDVNVPGGDLIINGGLSTTTGNITGEADRDIQFGGAGTITSNSGTVAFTAGTDLASATGQLTMDLNGLIDAGTGLIVLAADQDLRVTGLRTNFTSPPDAVTIRSENGTVFDAGDAATDVFAPNGCLNVTAPGGIDPTNPLETNVACASGAAAGASGGGSGQGGGVLVAGGGTAGGNQNQNQPEIFFLPGPGGTPGGGLTPGGGPPPRSTGGEPPSPEDGSGPGPGNPRPGGPPPDPMSFLDRGGRREPELPTDFLVNVSRIFAPDERDSVLPEPVRIDAVPITEQEVILRPLDGTGREIRNIRLPDEVLDDLPGLFKKLDRGRFRIYFREAGEERVLLIREVKLLDGRPVDDSDAGLDKPPTPAARTQPKK